MRMGDTAFMQRLRRWMQETPEARGVEPAEEDGRAVEQAFQPHSSSASSFPRLRGSDSALFLCSTSPQAQRWTGSRVLWMWTALQRGHVQVRSGWWRYLALRWVLVFS